MKVRNLFLEAVKASLTGTIAGWSEPVTTEEWQQFFQLAAEHKVVPMVFESVYNLPAFRETGSDFIPVLRRQVMSSVFLQVQKTEEFKKLYAFLSSKGLEPIIVKGILVRMLHPNPDNRSSGDEDFYIPEGTYQVYKDALHEFGMEISEGDKEIEEISHEVTYVKRDGVLNIEIHSTLFENKTSAYKGMNDVFEHAFENSILINVDGVEVRSLNHTDHMLFLILHAFKHFISGGFGIRLVCDMVMYGNQYGKEIDWDYLLVKCKELSLDKLAAALFDIGKRYLCFDWEKSGYGDGFKAISVDSENLLNDMIDAGVFGYSDMNRKHSSNMTLSAVSAEKEGKKQNNSLLKTIFPPASVLETQYAYLQKHVWMLPVAWAQRLLRYGKASVDNKQGNNAAETIKIGNERVELMREYGVIK